MLTITVFGGVAGRRESGQIGGNKILVEHDEKAYPPVFGTNFSGR